MLSVRNKPFVLGAFMLNFIMLSVDMLSVVNKPFMLSVVLSVVYAECPK